MTKEITRTRFFSVCAQLREFYPNCTLEVGYFEPFSGNGEIDFHILAVEPGCRVVVFHSTLNQPNGGTACANCPGILKGWLEDYQRGGAF